MSQFNARQKFTATLPLTFNAQQHGGFMFRYLVLTCFLALPMISQARSAVKIATSADAYPYTFGPADGCTAASGVCGFEVELFDAICKDMNLQCVWKTNDWGTIFDNLLNKTNGDFAYDAIVASTEASPERRKLMNFSARYFTAWHLFAGRTNLQVTMDTRGFPQDLASQPLKIGTWEGFLHEELMAAYGNVAPTHLSLMTVDDPIAALKNGDVDLIFVYTGIETKLIQDPQYSVKGPLIEVLNPDPKGGVGAASRKSTSGKEISKAFSEGLVKVRKSGEYQRISQKWLGRDIWDCQLGPKIDDPFCASP